MIALAILLGVSLTLTVAVAAATAYCLYHFVYRPWKVMRKDLGALNDRATAIQGELDILRKAGVFSRFSNEELASIERRLLRQSRQRATEAGER